MATTPVKYIGIFDEVQVEGLGFVKNGETVEADQDLAKSLLKQDTNWAAGKKSDVKTDNTEGA